MSSKWFKVLSVIIMLSMMLAACAQPATQPVIQCVQDSPEVRNYKAQYAHLGVKCVSGRHPPARQS